ncbi:hypothetical protein Anas_13546 [Armadillidium nasatum]|uniref:Uncharacterized protein n=1 Tax=Armadillidium nasatum TaxID=96803 RepID=A0A5N5T692_9CRUS|nr:hypothetical protein Anas_13546 [Armadillidium nasatum]
MIPRQCVGCILRIDNLIRFILQIPVLGSHSSAWLVSSAWIRIHSVSVSSTRISSSAVFNPESVHIYRL